MTNSQNDPAGFIPDGSSTQTQSAGSSGTVSPGASIKSMTDWLGGAANWIGDKAFGPVARYVAGYPQLVQKTIAHDQQAGGIGNIGRNIGGNISDLVNNSQDPNSLNQVEKSTNTTPADAIAAEGNILQYTLPVMGWGADLAKTLGVSQPVIAGLLNAVGPFGTGSAVSGFGAGQDTSLVDRFGNAALGLGEGTVTGATLTAILNKIAPALGKMGISPKAVGSQATSKGAQAVDEALNQTTALTPSGMSEQIEGTGGRPATPDRPAIPAKPGALDNLNTKIGNLLSQVSEKTGNLVYSTKTVLDDVFADLKDNVQGFAEYKGPNGDLNPKVAQKTLTKELTDRITNVLTHPKTPGVTPYSLQAIDLAREEVGSWVSDNGGFSSTKELIGKIGNQVYQSLSDFVQSETDKAGIPGYQGLLDQQAKLYAANAGLGGKRVGMSPFSERSAGFRSIFGPAMITGARVSQSPLTSAFGTLGITNFLRNLGQNPSSQDSTQTYQSDNPEDPPGFIPDPGQ